jgi:hypothetical protein
MALSKRLKVFTLQPQGVTSQQTRIFLKAIIKPRNLQLECNGKGLMLKDIQQNLVVALCLMSQ